jgi:hypothetical protein
LVAAPFFFEPIEILGKTYLDGGLSSYNPCLLAKREVDEMWPDHNIVMVSLGSGKLKVKDGKEKSSKSLGDTATKFFQDMLATLTNAADTHKSMIDQVGFSKGRIQYFRVDPPDVGEVLPYKAGEQDIDEMNIGVMKYLSNISQEMTDICDILGVDKGSEPPREDDTFVPQEKPEIIVTVLEAKKLIGLDLSGYSDPYVQIQVLPGTLSKYTNVEKKNLNPHWNQKFVIPCSKQIKQTNLSGTKIMVKFTVMNRNLLVSDQFIGSACVEVHDLIIGEPKLFNLKLDNVESGELSVKIESQLWQINVKSLQTMICKQSLIIDQLIDETELQKNEIVQLQDEVAALTKLVYSLLPPDKIPKLLSNENLSTTSHDLVIESKIEITNKETISTQENNQ